jgi:hypothetical protein
MLTSFLFLILIESMASQLLDLLEVGVRGLSSLDGALRVQESIELLLHGFLLGAPIAD